MEKKEQAEAAAGIMALVDEIEALVWSAHFNPNEKGESFGRDLLERLAKAAINLMDPALRKDAWSDLQAMFDDALAASEDRKED